MPYNMQARYKIIQKTQNLRERFVMSYQLCWSSCFIIPYVPQVTEWDCLNSKSRFPNAKSRANISRSPPSTVFRDHYINKTIYTVHMRYI